MDELSTEELHERIGDDLCEAFECDSVIVIPLRWFDSGLAAKTFIFTAPDGIRPRACELLDIYAGFADGVRERLAANN